MQRRKSKEILHIMIIALVAAIALAQFQTNAAKISTNNWLDEIKQSAIGCGPGTSVISKSNIAGSDHLPGDRNKPIDDHNGNGCPHQPAGALCKTNESKRRHAAKVSSR